MLKSIILTACISILLFSCSTKEKKATNIMDKVILLPEFKKAEKRIDSLNAVGIKAELQIGLIEDSFYPEDSTKNLSILLIEENYGFEQNTIYHIKFNKETNEIVDINPGGIKF